MTKTELLKIIQEVVRREVKKQVNEIFIKEENSTSLIELVSKPLTEKEFKEPIRKKQVKSKKEVHYTSNETLNQVLNETVGLSKKDKQFEEYPTVGGKTFDSSRMTELLGYGKPEEVKRDMVAVDTLQKAGKSVDDVPEHVTNALTRDYSDLMKAMDNKG